MVRHAATLINIFQVGTGGKTRYERMRGNKYLGDIAEFGETVMWKKKAKGSTSWADKWGEGVFLGIREESGEMIIGIKEGVERTGTIKRLGGMDERWVMPNLDVVNKYPWEVEVVEERAKGVTIDGGGREEDQDTKEDASSRPKVYHAPITTRDIKKHGGTQGCQGCRKVLVEGKYGVHTDGCRIRFEEMGTARRPKV